MRYKQLNLQERHYIELERKKGTFQKDIASALGRSCSTLCRELSRNTGQRGYRHIQANNKAFTRHKDKPKALLSDENHPNPKVSWFERFSGGF
ncbi:MAG: helix-turn-helix domain-containing protein [Ghiorsea sp.]|nr:helix-turn-helix domain-containing protein [Ghiorsea sp.]